jgi:hypothetical protein
VMMMAAAAAGRRRDGERARDARPNPPQRGDNQRCSGAETPLTYKLLPQCLCVSHEVGVAAWGACRLLTKLAAVLAATHAPLRSAATRAATAWCPCPSAPHVNHPPRCSRPIGGRHLARSHDWCRAESASNRTRTPSSTSFAPYFVCYIQIWYPSILELCTSIRSSCATKSRSGMLQRSVLCLRQCS